MVKRLVCNKGPLDSLLVELHANQQAQQESMDKIHGATARGLLKGEIVHVRWVDLTLRAR